MAFNRNQKFMVFLLAGMAIGISSFSTTGTAGNADFASEIASPDSDAIDSFTHDVESNKQDASAEIVTTDDMSVRASDPRNEQDNVRVKLTARQTDDDGNETMVEKTVSAKNLKDLSKILALKTKEIQKQARAKAKQEKDKRSKEEKLAEDIKNCKVKVSEDGKRRKAIDENNLREKLKCFAEQEQNLEGDELQDYKDSVVNKYVNSRLDSVKQMLGQGVGGAMSAKGSVAQLEAALNANGLQDQSMAQQFQFVNNVISARLPMNNAAAQSQLFAQFQPRLLNADPKVRAQAQIEYNAAMTQQMSNQVLTEIGTRNALMSQPASQDPQWNQIAAMTATQLSQNIQQQVYSNASLKQVYGSFIAPYSPSALDANTGVSLNTLNPVTSNPFNANNVFGNNSLDSLGLNSNWGITDTGAASQFWQSTPATGSNMANPSITTNATTIAPAVSQQMALNGKKVSVPR